MECGLSVTREALGLEPLEGTPDGVGSLSRQPCWSIEQQARHRQPRQHSDADELRKEHRRVSSKGRSRPSRPLRRRHQGADPVRPRQRVVGVGGVHRRPPSPQHLLGDVGHADVRHQGRLACFSELQACRDAYPNHCIRSTPTTPATPSRPSVCRPSSIGPRWSPASAWTALRRTTGTSTTPCTPTPPRRRTGPGTTTPTARAPSPTEHAVTRPQPPPGPLDWPPAAAWPSGSGKGLQSPLQEFDSPRRLNAPDLCNAGQGRFSF